MTDLTLLRNDVVVMTVPFANVTTLAGALAACIGIIGDLNSDLPESYYSLDSSTDVSAFLRAKDIPETDMNNYICGNINKGEYGLWMRGREEYLYNLYGFREAEFLQGVITMCQSFEVDFRNYIYQLPFDSDGKYHTLAGYLMATHEIAVTVPDLDDVDEYYDVQTVSNFEPIDDENITDPYNNNIDD